MHCQRKCRETGCLQRQSDVIFTPCTTDDKYQWGYILPITAASSVDRIFSSLKFERVELNELKGSPEAIVADVRAKRDAEVVL
ncbi:MAG: hypothetical protein ACLRX7_02785 [Acutalibacteraceae bacterium]